MEARVVNKRHGGQGTYIGRPGKYGNPFILGRDGDRSKVIALYREWFYAPEQAALREDALVELAGKTLVCWCKPQACHGDVLVEFLNNREGTT